jgi:hypothetical protein
MRPRVTRSMGSKLPLNAHGEPGYPDEDDHGRIPRLEECIRPCHTSQPVICCGEVRIIAHRYIKF